MKHHRSALQSRLNSQSLEDYQANRVYGDELPLAHQRRKLAKVNHDYMLALNIWLEGHGQKALVTHYLKRFMVLNNEAHKFPAYEIVWEGSKA